MYRKSWAIALVLLAYGSLAHAQDAPRLRWTVGQVLLYRTEHNTTMTQTTGENKAESKTAVRTTKRWLVTAVDTQGIATMQLSLTAMQHERTTSTGDKLTFDSADPEKATPQLKAALSKFLDKTIAVLRVDPYGRVVEVKESIAPTTSYEHELPFLAMLPGAMPKAGQAWDRVYKITLAPPLGTGEKYDAVQKYTCKEAKDDLLTLTLKTELKTPPTATADGVPLWQMLPEGEIVVDLKNGRLKSAALGVDREMKQGDKGSVKFQSKLNVTWIEK